MGQDRRSRSPASATIRGRSPADDSATIRGFSNESGANNCFLNCAVQALWNLDPFRAAFMHLDKHHCDGKSCIFCALGVLAVEYQYHAKGPITPDILRHALAETYQDNNKFQLGYMDDAAECFESLLCRLHLSLSQQQSDCSSTSDSDTSCTSDHCIAHRLFSMTLVEQIHCLCGSTSEPVPFSQYIFYVPVTCVIESFSKDVALSFATLIHQASADKRPCADSDCTLGKLKGSVRVSLIEKPDIFCVGFAWPSDNPTDDITHSLIDCLEPDIELDYIFHHVLTPSDNLYELVGIMAYYGRHYFTFFYHSGVAKWLLYDDAQVKEIGSDWEDVKKIMLKGRYQPLILIYVSPNPTNKMSSGKKIAKEFREKTHKCRETPPKLMTYLGSPNLGSSHPHPEKLRNKDQLKIGTDDTSPRYESVNTSTDKPPSYKEITSPDHSNNSQYEHSAQTKHSDHTNFLDNMFDEVGQKFHEGLSLLGISEAPDERQKRKHIEECFKQAAEIYLMAKKYQITRDYEKALDYAVQAAQFYKYIMKHENSSLPQRSQAKIHRETVLIRCRRIYRNIPQTKLKIEHLEVLFSQCPNCDQPRPDQMQLCYKCTKTCIACNHVLDLYEVDYCSKCTASCRGSPPNTKTSFERNLQKHGTTLDDVVWYHTSTNAQISPPPYDSLPARSAVSRALHPTSTTASAIIRPVTSPANSCPGPSGSSYTDRYSRLVTNCVLCGQGMGNLKGAICHKCSVNIDKKY